MKSIKYAAASQINSLRGFCYCENWNNNNGWLSYGHNRNSRNSVQRAWLPIDFKKASTYVPLVSFKLNSLQPTNLSLYKLNCELLA